MGVIRIPHHGTAIRQAAAPTARLWQSLALAAVATGCGGSGETASTTVTPPAPAVAAQLILLAGDDQDGTIGDQLPAELRFKVVSATGQPVADATIHLQVTQGGGTVPQEVLLTDATGEAHTPWTLGPVPGRHALVAASGALPVVTATATASVCDLVNCADDELAPDIGDWKLLELDTYEGSGQATHPDVVRGGPGLRWFWMAVTPYPNSDITKENPSLFQSHNGRFWRVPRGLANPVAQPTLGYLSDPDMVFDAATRRLWLYYRQVTGENLIWLVRSSDGVRWDTPVKVVSAPNHEAVSPSVVHNAPHAPWIMFTANTHAAGCTSRLTTMDRRTSTDGVTWSAPQSTDLAQPGQTIWHLDVVWVPARSEYWALYNTYPSGYSCATDAVYFARSQDGQHWQTYPSPVIRKGVIPAFRDLVYRSTMMVNDRADSVRLWVSGARFDGGYEWRTATVARRTDEFFADLVQPPSARHPSDLVRRDLPPPEPDVGPSGGGMPPLPARLRP